MNQAARFPRRARWAVPLGGVAVVGVVAAGSVLAGAQAAPALPARTPAQLIAAIAANKRAPAALSGTIVTNAALGLPSLPAAGGPASIPSLLAGSHTFEFWYAGPGLLRIAVPVSLGETDLRVDGRQVWLWDSQTNTATRLVRPARPGPATHGRRRLFYSGGSFYSPNKANRTNSPSKAYSSALSVTTSQAEAFSAAGSYAAAPTPQSVARSLLATVGPTTTVSVQSNVMIAGQAAYQLVLAPKNHDSLIGRVSIAVDAGRYLPLRVQVFARGAANPAYQIGFTSISFARPAASNFSFTPPAGAKVKTVTIPASPLAGLSGGNGGGFFTIPKGIGTYPGGPQGSSMPSGSISVAPGLPTPTRSAMTRQLRRAIESIRKGPPKNLSKSQRQHLLKALNGDIGRINRPHPGAGQPGAGVPASGWYAYAPSTGGTFPAGLASAPRTIGSGWMTVGVFPAPGLTAGPAGGAAGALLRAATPVHGSWGSGRLLRTSLLSVLITSNGRVLIGAVAPSVLYAAASQAK
jgi:outer membrane lipoprotein-sorting protein